MLNECVSLLAGLRGLVLHLNVGEEGVNLHTDRGGMVGEKGEWRVGGGVDLHQLRLVLPPIHNWMHDCSRLRHRVCVCTWTSGVCSGKKRFLIDGRRVRVKERAQERKRCMCMISKADIRTPIRGQCALLLLVERAGVRKHRGE